MKTMKKWWIANAYWLIMVAFLAYQLFTYRAEDGSMINGAAATIVLVSVVTLISEFQFAWYMWLTGKTFIFKRRHKRNLKF